MALNMANPTFAAIANNAVADCTNRLNFAINTVNQVNASIAYPQNTDGITTVSYQAELVVANARVTGLNAELAALNAILLT